MFGTFVVLAALAMLTKRPNVRQMGKHRTLIQRPPASCSTSMVLRSTLIPNPLSQHSMKLRQKSPH